MILDFRDLATLPPAPAGVVIVGSGAAGLALVLALAERGQHVIVLESGGDLVEPAAASRAAHLNEGRVVGLPYDLVHSRARVLGGTTEAWRGQCMRLHDIDMQERPWVRNSGWPISLGDLSADYAAAEQWLGVTGLGYGTERWSENPSLRPLQWDQRRLLHDFTEFTPDPFLGRRHRERLARLASVHVVLNATAAQVLLDESGAATGVEVVGRDLSRRVVHGRRVVLAAGAIENARLLQLSSSDGVGLGTGREQTGRFLQDHPIVLTAEVLPYDYRVLQDRFVALHKGRRKLFPKVRLSPEAQAEHELLDATAVFLHEHDDQGFQASRRLLQAARARTRPDDLLGDTVRVLRSSRTAFRDVYRRTVHGMATGARPSHVWLQLWLEQAPDPRSRVALDDAVDALGLRRVTVDWRSGEQEMRTGRQLTRWIADDLRRLHVADVRELPAMTDDAAWRATMRDAAHSAGTTRMAAQPRDGVVDTNLAVHGVPGLYVVGSSVFPASGYANPTLTIVALALRLGRHLRGEAPSNVSPRDAAVQPLASSSPAARSPAPIA